MGTKTIKTLILLLFSLMMMACISSTGVRLAQPLNTEYLHKTVYIDENFNDYEENVIINALKNWECSTHEMVKFDIKLHYSQADSIFITNKPGQLLILKTIGTDPLISSLDDKQDKTRRVVGVYYASQNESIPFILLPTDRIRDVNFKAIVEHEIGHSLGIGHITSRNAVMFRNIDQGSRRIMHDDLEALCKSYWCDDDKMRACN